MSEKQATTREPRRKVAIGDEFGRWTVIGKPFRGGIRGKRIAVCESKCGTISIVDCYNLKKGVTKSCGCLMREIAVTSNTTHGMTGTHLHAIWAGVIQRCDNPNTQNYGRYGGRGISMCDEWRDLKVFAKWAFEHGYQEGLSIERINTNGNYEPGNCTWIPLGRQARNTRRSRYLTAFGETKIVIEWLEDPRCVVGRACLRERIELGWNAERAIATPARPRPLARE